MGQKGPSILLQSKLGKFPWPIAQQALKSVTEPARAQCWEAELPPPHSPELRCTPDKTQEERVSDRTPLGGPASPTHGERFLQPQYPHFRDHLSLPGRAGIKSGLLGHCRGPINQAED